MRPMDLLLVHHDVVNEAKGSRAMSGDVADDTWMSKGHELIASSRRRSRPTLRRDAPLIAFVATYGGNAYLQPS